MSSLLILVTAALRHPLIQVLSVIGATFILEDAATVSSPPCRCRAVPYRCRSASSRSTPASSSAISGFTDWVDLPPRCPGWSASFPRDAVISGRDWLNSRLARVILVSRFLPGLRLPTYTTCGFLRTSFLVFALTATVATLIWTSLLFSISMKLGHYIMAYLGAWRWAGNRPCYASCSWAPAGSSPQQLRGKET